MNKLPKLKYSGEECEIKNRNKQISYNQKNVIKSIFEIFNVEFYGKLFGEAWDFIRLYDGKEYKDENGEIKIFSSIDIYNNKQALKCPNCYSEMITLDGGDVCSFCGYENQTYQVCSIDEPDTQVDYGYLEEIEE